MHFITKKHLDRRTVLRGLGMAMPLPFLSAMVPAATPDKQVFSNNTKFGAVYVPHGAVAHNWVPETAGELKLPFTLQPMAGLEKYTTIISGMRNKPAEDPDPHNIVAGTWLTCTNPEKNSAHGGTSIDQIIASYIGQDTPKATLEVSATTGGGSTHSNCLSYTAHNFGQPPQPNPRILYYALFGQGDTLEEKLAIANETKANLDSIKIDLASMRKNLGAEDLATLDEYLDGVRQIERQLRLYMDTDWSKIDVPEAPIGTPNNYPDHLALQYDMIAVALQAGVTNVFTYMTDKEVSMRTFIHLGNTDAFQPLSQHGDRRADMDRLSIVQQWQVSEFAKFVNKLKNTNDGNGSLLDNSVLLYGSNMGNSNLHNQQEIPSMIVAGNNYFKGNEHIQTVKDTPLSNMMLTILDRLNLPVTEFSDANALI